jgi:hypothetical protein
MRHIDDDAVLRSLLRDPGLQYRLRQARAQKRIAGKLSYPDKGATFCVADPPVDPGVLLSICSRIADALQFSQRAMLCRFVHETAFQHQNPDRRPKKLPSDRKSRRTAANNYKISLEDRIGVERCESSIFIKPVRKWI